MRLSEWRDRAPTKDSVGPKVMAVVEAALVTLGAERDPECWVAWGDDPAVRYLVLAPTPSGLVQLNVRVNVPGEGPRAGGKVVRWARVQLGELGVEIQGGHRLVTFQVETQVLNGVDEAADRIAAFAQALFAAVDGRPIVAGRRVEAQRARRRHAAKPAEPPPSLAAAKPAKASGALGRPGRRGTPAADAGSSSPAAIPTWRRPTGPPFPARRSVPGDGRSATGCRASSSPG